MNSKKPLTTSTRNSESKGKKLPRCNLEAKKEASETDGKSQVSFSLTKGSMIPRPKLEIHCNKDVQQKQNKCKSRSKPTTPAAVENESDAKLKKLEEKENSIAEYYLKIEALIRKVLEKKNSEKLKVKPASRKTLVRNHLARKMVSDPLVFKKEYCKNNIISEFENGMYEISDIWLKTSLDLSKTLQILTKDLPLYPVDFEMKRVTIQKAIRKARSFTMMKTRNVIAETRKLLSNADVVQNEFEPFAKYDSKFLTKTKVKTDNQLKQVRNENGNKVSNSSELMHCNKTVSQKQVIDYNNDGLMEPIQEINQCGTKASSKSLVSAESSIKEIEESIPRIKIENDEPFAENYVEGKQLVNTSQVLSKDWAAELGKNEKAIMHLKNKVFDLQKVCNEHFLKCSDLQLKLVDFSRKIQWDQILLKKIGNIEEMEAPQPIKELFRVQNKEWESKVKKFAEELDTLMKVNYALFQQKILQNQQDKSIQTLNLERSNNENGLFDLENLEKRLNTFEKLIWKKQNVIDQLKSILKIMKNQESLAQMHTAEFQAKIEDHKRLQN